MAELSPVETLRAAAAKLRETATGTSVPPWYEDGQEGVYAYGAPGEPCPQVFRDRRVRYQDVLWIELVHPGVAEPLAALFEFEVHQHDAFGFAIGDRFLALARVLLGVPDA